MLLLLCLVCRVMAYMASRRITFASSVASWPTWRRVASLCPCSCNTSRPAVVVASLASASPCLQLVVVGRISCYHHLHLASYCGQRHVGHLGWRVLLVDHHHDHLQLACAVASASAAACHRRHCRRQRQRRLHYCCRSRRHRHCDVFAHYTMLVPLVLLLLSTWDCCCVCCCCV